MGLAFACPFGYLWMFLGRRDGLLCSLSRGLIFLPFHVLLACGLVLLVCRYIWFALLHLVSFRLLVFGYSPLLYLLFWSLRNSPLLDLLLPLDLFFPQEVGSFAVVLSFYPSLSPLVSWVQFLSFRPFCYCFRHHRVLDSTFVFVAGYGIDDQEIGTKISWLHGTAQKNYTWAWSSALHGALSVFLRCFWVADR